MNRYINKTNRRIKCFLFIVTIGLVLSWNADAFSLLTPTELSLKTERICRECHNLDVIIHFDKTQEDWALVLKSMRSYGARIEEKEIPEIASELAKKLPFKLGVMASAKPYYTPGSTIPSVIPFTLYIPNEADGSVSVIDSYSNKVYALVPFFTSPHTSAVSPDGSFALVTNSSSESNFLAVVDTQTNKIVSEIKVGKRPRHVELSRDGKFAYVANQAENSVSIVNIAERKEVAQIKVGEGPHVPKSDREEKFLWVTNEFESSVSVIDLEQKKVIDTITVGLAPMGLAFSLDNRYAFVSNTASGTVSVIDVQSRKIIKSITVGIRPNQIEFSSWTEKAYVAVAGESDVAVIDNVSLEVVERISLGKERGAHGIVFNPSGRFAYVTNQGSNSVSLIKLSSEYSGFGIVISTIPVGRFPSCI